jgi:predicted acylesterase/phospholipase RssA
MKNIKYAAGGGGTAGIIHIGALKAFNEDYIDLSSIVGVSAGSIFGGLFFYNQIKNNFDRNKTYFDMFTSFMNLNFKNFQDINWFYRSFLAILKYPEKAGLYKGRKLLEWCIKETEGITFAELPDKSLYIIATEMYSGSLCVFSKETTPDLSLGEAMRASSSIQGYFRPAQIHIDKIEKGFFYKNKFSIAHQIQYEEIIPLVNDDGKCLFWDGGNLGNCRNDIAVKIGDYDTPVIGVSLTEDPKMEIKNFNIFGVLSKTIDIMMSSMENVVISLSKAHSNRPDYLIKPDRLGVDATDFDIASDTKIKLIDSGYNETKKIIGEKL